MLSQISIKVNDSDRMAITRLAQNVLTREHSTDSCQHFILVV